MNREKMVPGIILIGIGALFLLRNMGIIHWWTLGSLWRFWPLILVVIGINTIFHRSTAVAVITWIGFFAIIIGYSITTPQAPPWDHVISVNESPRTPIVIPATPQTESGILNLNTGAIQLTIKETEDSLVTVSGFPFQPEYRLNSSSDGKTQEITIDTSSRNWRGNEDSFRGIIELNKDVRWRIDTKLGAVSTHMDLSQIELEQLNMEVGAGDVTLILAQSEEESEVTINAGTTQLVLELPQEINGRIHTQSVLTQTSINENDWRREGDTYFSEDYDASSPTLDITVEMGVGRLEVISR
ncbi:MAG: DUF5668 domain-containing protein [Bacillota bacterium]|nr:DUF5668 domain-containing protein [Bacillota bacterium]